jgi:hypothetical protein
MMLILTMLLLVGVALSSCEQPAPRPEPQYEIWWREATMTT